MVFSDLARDVLSLIYFSFMKKNLNKSYIYKTNGSHIAVDISY